MWVSRLLTAGGVTLSSRAVADKLPVRTKRLKNAISDGAELGVVILESYSTMN
jgi:hypothetical protein